AAAESSDAWNNAGTGHSAFCELNYTPEAPDGSIPIDRAAKIASSFEISKQLWASLVARGVLHDTDGFVRPVPHRTVVTGEDGVGFLRRRHAAMTASPLFRELAYSEDPRQLDAWMPLMMEGRETGPAAATSCDLGTDVNFGVLTREMLAALVASG